MRHRVAMLAALAALACGGGGDSGTTQPPSTGVLTAVQVSPPSVNLNVGQTQTLVVTPLDQNAQAITGLGAPTFLSTDLTKVTVSTGGQLNALASGTVLVTASVTANGVTKSGTTTVIVGSQAAPAAMAVDMPANFFNPTAIEVAVGGTVTFTNTTSTDHNVIFAGGAGKPADVPTGNHFSVARTFNTAGTFPFTCTLHTGMNGTITVR